MPLMELPRQGTPADLDDPSHTVTSGKLLSDCELKRFHDEGFLLLADVCIGAELARMHGLLAGLFERATGYDEGNLFDMLGTDHKGQAASQPQLLEPSLYAPQLLLTAHFDHIQAIARQLLGDDAQFNFDHSIVKRAGTLAATPWHQDEAHHRDPDREFDQISFWMPMQDVAEHNGCLCYLPGSNQGAVLPHRSLGGDTSLHALECPDTEFDLARSVALPMRAGSCVMHGGRTLHGALPNTSGGDRMAYVLVFRGAPRPRTDRARFAWLDAQHAADADRKQRWLRHGGHLVVLMRRLRRRWSLRRLAAIMRRRWRVRS
jgi:ectoine hydroxylase-related dioxygenase (phytanoyl-CoA dioxygenase family)